MYAMACIMRSVPRENELKGDKDMKYEAQVKELEKVFWELDKDVTWEEDSEKVGEATVLLADLIKKLRKIP